MWSLNVLSQDSCFLPQSEDIGRLTGDAKVSTGVSVNSCLSLYVSPVIGWRPVDLCSVAMSFLRNPSAP